LRNRKKPCSKSVTAAIFPDEIVITSPSKIAEMILISKQGEVAPKDWLSDPFQAGDLEDGIKVLIFSEYIEFSAA